MKKPSLGAITNLALIVAAAFVVWNTMWAQAEARPLPGASPVTQRSLEDWEEQFEAGIQVGPADAPIEVIELMDFQCPFCRAWAERLDSLEVEFPGTVRVSFHHWPLRRHTHAIPAAIATECAVRQGAFAPFARAVFAQQDSIGTRSWRSFAIGAGIADLEAFEACAVLPADSFPRIQHGIELARQVSARGTPTVWVNGEFRSPPPSLEDLRRLVREGGR